MAKNYNTRSKLYKALGNLTIGITTLGGFYAYESYIDWENFKNDVDNFVVVQEESVKLNLVFALPFLIGVLVYLFVMRKRNADFFKDKASISLLFAITISYLIYSVIELALFSMIGAFVGSLADELGFSMLSKKAKEKAVEDRDIEIEYAKEINRIKAREQALSDLNGSV